MPVTNYVWDVENDSYLMETDEAGDTTAVYTNEPGHYGPLISQRRNGQTSYYHFDGQQSTRQLTDENQNVTDEYTYTAFGETVASSGATTNPFGYKGALGYYANPETNELYVRARRYQPRIARWSAPDPLFLVEMAQYVYGRNDPLARIDPSGLLSYEVPSDIGAFVANSCGAYRFVVDWDVGDVQESGFVVQFMRVDISQDRCDDKKNECGCYNCGWNTYVNRTRQEYTEVWYVAYDRKKKKPTIYDHFCRKPSGDLYQHRGRRDIWCFGGYDPDRFNFGTCGGAEVYGLAFFVPVDALDTNEYSYGDVRWAGILLSRQGYDQALLTKKKGPEVERWLSLVWNCCGPKVDPKPGIHFQDQCCWTLGLYWGLSPKNSEKSCLNQWEETACESSRISYTCPQDIGTIPCKGQPAVLPSN